MSRPRKPANEKPRITVRPYTEIGYAELIGRIWKTRIAGKRESTRVSIDDGREGRDRVKAILEYRIKQHLGEISKPPPISTMGELIKEYDRARVSKWPASRAAQFTAARRCYLADEWPLEYQGLKLSLLAADERLQKGRILRSGKIGAPLSAPTRANYLIRIRQLFDYAIGQEYMKKNPIREAFEKLGAPTRKVAGFTAAEMEAIHNWMAADPALRPASLFFRLQALIGARADEIASLRRAAITPAGFWIDGKGGRRRWFPLLILPELAQSTDPLMVARREWLQEIQAIIDELMGMKEGGEKLLPISLHAAEYRLRKCRRELGMDIADGRNSHAVRKYAIWYWRTVLHLPRPVRAELAGHDDEIARRIYDDFSPEESARSLLTGLV